MVVVLEKFKTIHKCVGTQKHNSTSRSVVQMMGNCEKHSALIEGNFIRKLLFKREKGAALEGLISAISGTECECIDATDRLSFRTVLTRDLRFAICSVFITFPWDISF